MEELQKNWKTLLAEGADVAASTEPLKLADAEWKKRLSPQAYAVLFEEDTEPPRSSPLDWRRPRHRWRPLDRRRRRRPLRGREP